jgi:hypothetical protein
VRCVLAIVLLTLVSASLVVPASLVTALVAQTAPVLPICCRNAGKHKCAMRAVAPSALPAHSSIRTLRERCPFSSTFVFLCINSPGSLAHRPQPLAGPAAASRARHSAAEALPCVAFTLSRPERGPPSLSA